MPYRLRSARFAVSLSVAMAVVLAGTSAGAFAQSSDSSATPPPAATPSLPPAGVIPANVTLTLSGAPTADTIFAYDQILAELTREIAPTLRFGASVTYGTVTPWPLVPLALGVPAAVNVTVSIAGGDELAPVTGVTTVVVNSVTVPPVEPERLYLSDDPEYLTMNGLVFRGDVASARAARLYYYHSDIGLPRDVDVVLTATAPTRVQVIGSSAGPDQDVMAVGHAVTRDFLKFERANEGMVVDVLPGKPFVVRHVLLLQGELVAGALDVQVLGGGPVSLSVVATGAGENVGTYLAGPRVALDGHHRHGTFALGRYGAVVGSFTVGGPPAVAQIGTKALSPTNVDPTDDGHDYGDYGIIRKFTFTLANPTADTHRVYLYEKPLAGNVSSSFVVDGQFKELDCVHSRQPYTVWTYELPPHSTGATTTLTMPDGGSYYPLEFGVTDAQPNLNTPFDGSPDSCRPNAAEATPAPAATPAAGTPSPAPTAS